MLLDYCLYKLNDVGIMEVFCRMVVLFLGLNVMLMFKFFIVCWWIVFWRVMWVFIMCKVGFVFLMVNGVMFVVKFKVRLFFNRVWWIGEVLFLLLDFLGICVCL